MYNVILTGFDKGIWWLQGKSIIIYKISSYKSAPPPPQGGTETA